MPRTATAKQLRDRLIPVPVPGTDMQIECRCPDLLDEIANGWLPLERFGEVIENVGQWALAATPGELAVRAAADIRKDPARFAEFIDRWACAAAVSPRIVLERAVAEKDEAVLWIDDVDYDVKLAILRGTNRKLVARSTSAAVSLFRREQSAGDGAGSDGKAVRDAAVGAAAD